MSATIPPNFQRLFSQLADAARQPLPRQGVQGPVSTPENLTGTQQPAPAQVRVEKVADGFDPTSAVGKQDWSARFACAAPGETPALGGLEGAVPEIGGDDAVIAQTKDNNCGAAVATMLAQELGAPETEPKEQKMEALESRFTHGTGTNSHQLSDMLAHAGAAVTRGAARFDRDALDAALARGGKAAMLVDSSEIRPESRGSGEAGKAHWVMVDGKDARGNYIVKDPSDGSTYWVGTNDMARAVDSSWNQHQGGGMLIVENAQGRSEAEVAQESMKHTDVLGATEGGGSRTKANYGRESS